MIRKCKNCGDVMVLGKREGEHYFCSSECLNNFRHPGFCPDCSNETTDEPAGNLHTLNGIGLRFYGKKHECPVCFSAIRRKWFCVLFIPVIPCAAYRVKFNTRTIFFSRKTKPNLDKQVELRVRSGARKQ